MRFLFALLAIMVIATAVPAQAHDWYPNECCSGKDCSPVTSAEPDSKGGFNVTAQGMHAYIWPDFPWRMSHDAQMHVCLRKSQFGFVHVMCAFRSPGT